MESDYCQRYRFPYPNVYKDQGTLMDFCYNTISDGKIGIVESPTGTGKTMSMLCASLTWLTRGEDETVNVPGKRIEGISWIEKKVSRDRQQRTWCQRHTDSLLKNTDPRFFIAHARTPRYPRWLPNSKKPHLRVNVRCSGVKFPQKIVHQFRCAEIRGRE